MKWLTWAGQDKDKVIRRPGQSKKVIIPGRIGTEQIDPRIIDIHSMRLLIHWSEIVGNRDRLFTRYDTQSGPDFFDIAVTSTLDPKFRQTLQRRRNFVETKKKKYLCLIKDFFVFFRCSDLHYLDHVYLICYLNNCGTGWSRYILEEDRGEYSKKKMEISLIISSNTTAK